jgi:hypothetical protein
MVAAIATAEFVGSGTSADTGERGADDGALSLVVDLVDNRPA